MLLIGVLDVDDGQSFRTPTAFVSVTTAASLHFVVDPGRLWVLERDREYRITVDLYDSDARKMLITDVSDENRTRKTN